METFALSFVPIVLVLTIGWIVRTVTHHRRMAGAAKLQADLHAKLVERFGTAQELQQFLQSDAGSRLVVAPSVERANPYARILGSVQAGILVLASGIALFVVSNWLPGDAVNGFRVLGGFGVMLGIGFLASAAASFVLSKRWGLIEGQPHE